MLEAEGMGGPYGQRRARAVLSVAGNSTLSRVAFTQLSRVDLTWTFGAVNVEAGQRVSDVISRLAGPAQVVDNTGTESRRTVKLVPAPGDNRLAVLLDQQALEAATRDAVAVGVTEALMIENPHLSSPRTVDCGSCHVASRNLGFAVQAKGLSLESFAERFLPVGSHDLSRVDGVGNNEHAMRAFGYLGNRVALSQRTINESAHVCDVLFAPLE